MVADGAQKMGVAQRRFVLAPASQIHRRRGALQGQSLLPDPGPGKILAHQIIQRIQRRPGRVSRIDIMQNQTTRPRPCRRSAPVEDR